MVFSWRPVRGNAKLALMVNKIGGENEMEWPSSLTNDMQFLHNT
jgi:hypothetical protein